MCHVGTNAWTRNINDLLQVQMKKIDGDIENNGYTTHLCALVSKKIIKCCNM